MMHQLINSRPSKFQLRSCAWLLIVKELVLTVDREKRDGDECSSVGYIWKCSCQVREIATCHFCAHLQWIKSTGEQYCAWNSPHSYAQPSFPWLVEQETTFPRLLRPWVRWCSTHCCSSFGIGWTSNFLVSFRGAFNKKRHRRQKLLLPVQHHHWVARGWIQFYIFLKQKKARMKLLHSMDFFGAYYVLNKIQVRTHQWTSQTSASFWVCYFTKWRK